MLEQKEHSIWCEKYRPQNLDKLIGNEKLKEKLKIYLESGDIPHLLLFGPAGTGKSSCSKILAKHIKCDSLYVNASDETSVENVRTKIKQFASTIGFNDLKIVILDECLEENTLIVVLRKGKVQKIPIKNLDDKNDLVKSFNIDTDKIQWMPFELFNKGEQEIFEIEFENNEKIICTSDHKWYVKDKSGKIIVVKTSELKKYNYILTK